MTVDEWAVNSYFEEHIVDLLQICVIINNPVIAGDSELFVSTIILVKTPCAQDESLKIRF